MGRIYKYLDYVTYWSIVVIPFSLAIAPALANTFLGFLFFSFLCKRIINKENISIYTVLNAPFWLLLFISLVSFKNSVDYQVSLHGILKLVKYWAAFLICSKEIRDKKHIERILLSIILGASLISLDAFWQIIFGRDFIRGNMLQSAIGLVRPTASFPNPNVMGVYLSAITPLIIGLTFFYYKAKIRTVMFLPSILAVAGIYSTFSRGSGLGFYLAFLFLSIVRKNKRLTAALIIFLLIFPFVMPKNIKDWSREIRYNPLVFMCNYDRLSIYKNTLNMIRHHPFFGVGVNTFSKNYSRYKLPEPESGRTPNSIYAHNSFLHMTGEIGLLGLGAFFWLLFRLFKKSLSIYRNLKDEYYKIISLSILACLIAFLINGLTETSLYYSRVVMIFWYLIGFSLALEKFTPPFWQGRR